MTKKRNKEFSDDGSLYQVKLTKKDLKLFNKVERINMLTYKGDLVHSFTRLKTETGGETTEEG